MSQPSYLASGTKSLPVDTRRIRWQKILGAKQNLLGSSAKTANNPARGDTLRRTKVKLLNVLRSSVPQGSFTFPSDADAAAFVCGWLNICAAQTGACTSTNNCPPGTAVPIDATCASFCGINQKTVNAINDLVTSLKAASLWDLMDVIYPFVGGNSGACSLNLKDTTKFAITWHGSVTFSSAGATGNGTTGYGDTGFVPSVDGVNFTLNSAAIGVYINSTNQSNVMGAADVVGEGSILEKSIFGWTAFINGNAAGEITPIPQGVPSEGNHIATRTAANLSTLYVPFGGPSTSIAATTILANFSIYVLSANSAGIPSTFSNATMGFAWAGTGFSGAQVATLQGIINTFVAAK